MIFDHSNNRSTTPRLGVWVVVALALVAGWMTWQWVVFHTGTSISNRVGVGTMIRDDVLAAVILTSQIPSTPPLTQKTPTFLLLGNDGVVTEVEKGVFDAAVINASMPPWWMLPGAVGVAYVKEGDAVVARAMRKASDGLHVSAPTAETMRWPIPSNASIGMLCDEFCGSAFPYPIENRAVLDGATVFQVPGGDRSQTLVVFGSKMSANDAISFLKEQVRWQTPVETQRITKNGRRITEWAPIDVEDVTATKKGGVTTVGTDAYAWALLEIDGAVAASTSREILDEYTRSIDTGNDDAATSTLALTEKVCGVRPAAFFTQDFSQVLADYKATIARGARSWMLCNIFR